MTRVVEDGEVRTGVPSRSDVGGSAGARVAAAAGQLEGADGAPVPAAPPVRRRPQIGSDHRTAPNPAVPPRASALTLILGRIALAVTVVSWLAYVVTVAGRQLVPETGFAVRSLLESVVYVVLVSFLALSAVCYLITRQGYYRRTRSHVRIPRAELEAFFEDKRPSLTVLVPSYCEEPEVILQTVLSAALQEMAGLRVVLLIDNPPQPQTEPAQDLLAAARGVPAQVMDMLEVPRLRFAARLDQHVARVERGAVVAAPELARLAEDYAYAATWIEDLAAGWVCHDHTDDFFVDHVLRAQAKDLRVVQTALELAVADGATMGARRVVQLQRRLVSIFTVEVTSFERKQYASLSSEPNKAMNLNSYIGLLGGSYVERATSAGTVLVATEPGDPSATLVAPACDYVLTLDADSVLLPEYCLRIVYALEQPEHARAGVFQTPYSAFPGAPTRVERLAGATTDVQHIVHQGMAEYGAAYWVGANAVLRMEALRDLEVHDRSEGQLVRRYISDRTVIEDTESTLDLTAKGWTVENYPERLAYSASPPDFGSLCIQRQRWANGGLIILGKLAGHWRAQKERGERRRIVELLLRLNYLGSIAWATAGLILLLAYPFDQHLMSLLVVSLSVPYFAIMALDLRRCGHKSTDVLRIYGFNLIMLPVNASGVARTVIQMITGQKVAFRRTPKVRHRSIAPASFVIFSYLIVALSAFALVNDIHHERWAHAVFSGLNMLIAAPAILAIIGLKHSVIDVWFGFVNRLYTTPKRVAVTVEDPVVDWAAVLYHGTLDHPASLPSHLHRELTPALDDEVNR